MSKKKILLLCLIFFSILCAFFLIPFIQDKYEVYLLKKKMISINSLMSGKKSVSYTKKIVYKNVSSRHASLEKELNQSFKDFIESYSEIDSILSDKEYKNMFLVSNMNEESISSSLESLKNKKDLLSSKKISVGDLLDSFLNYPYCKKKDKKNCSYILSFFDKKGSEKYLKSLDRSLLGIQSDYEILDYLSQHLGDWHISSKKVEFTKRKSFDDFSQLKMGNYSDKCSYSLIKDDKGPNIAVEDATLYLYGDYNIEEHISCRDDVDGDVECSIDGSFDSNQIGDYPIRISAKDQSGNKSDASFTIHVIERPKKPYSIDVIRNQNVVIVYGLDSSGNYSNVVQVFTCSTGRNNNTPTGDFSTTRGGVWGALYGGVWGQYTTRIVSDILFHSVPYFSRDKAALEWEEYNKLGTQASMGCVRLTVRDAKWIFNNCPNGTPVHIFDGDLPNGISKPDTIYIDGNNSNRGWDPTDDDSSNPWR